MKRLALLCATLAVSAVSVAQAGDSSSITGRVLVNPLTVEVTRPDEPLRRGRWFRVVAQVTNGGATRLDGVGVTLVRPPALLLQGPATQTIPRIPARASRRANWEACSNTPGGYVVLARAEVGPFTAESAGALIQILPSNRTC